MSVENSYIEEGFSSDILNTVKAQFWSRTLLLWTGGISIGNWVGGVAFNAVRQGKVDITKSFIHQSIGDVINPIAKLAILRIFFVSLLPTVLLGLVLYNIIRYRDVLLLRNLEVELRNALQLLNCPDISKDLSIKYQVFLKEKVSDIPDPKERLQFAINGYINYLIDNVFKKLIEEYVKIYKENHINIEFVTTYRTLAELDLIRHPGLRNSSDIAKLLNETIDVYINDSKKKEKIYKKLDSMVVSTIQNAVITDGFFSNVVDYFKNPKASKYGSLMVSFMAISDIAVGSIIHGLGKSLIYSSLVGLYGATAASLATALLPFMIVVFGYAIHRSLDLSETKKIILITKEVTYLSKELRVKLPETVIEKYKYYLENDCMQFSDKKLRVRCALVKYLNIFTDKIYIPIIGAYAKYIKTNYDVNIRDVRSIMVLSKLTEVPQSDNIAKSFRNLYDDYNTIIKLTLEFDNMIVTKQYQKINKYIETLD